jgi:TfoX/Sxy family transcriptional regulator of competence genes
MVEPALAILEDAAAGLPYTRRKMMGHDCLFAPAGIFALVADGGRIGLRLAEPEAYETLSGLDGAGLWSPMGKRPMRHWVLVPESFLDESATLRAWVQRAHGLAGR